MSDPRPSFWQEYIAFWSNRPVVTRYLMWMFVPSCAGPLISGLFHCGNWQTMVARFWLLALFAAMALGGAVLIVANERLKRHGERTSGQDRP